MLKYLFFCFILTLTTGFSANGQLYTFRSFDHKDGLSLSSVLSVAEDQDGFIWFGTDGAGLIDRNEDIWITSKLSGIFRVSLEPFMALKFHAIYENDKIFFIGTSTQEDVLLSTIGSSFLGNLEQKYGFDE